MKTITLLILISISVTAKAQYAKPNPNYNDNYLWRTSKLIIPTTLLVGTFTTIEIAGNDLTNQEKATIAITGSLTSAILYFALPKRSKSEVKRRRGIFSNIKFR